MKRLISFLNRILLIAVIGVIFIYYNSLYAQNKLRIGTFDSRAIAIAYFNSEYASASMEQFRKIKNDYREAIENKDTVKSKKLEREGQMRQAMLHEKGFGTGSVRDCMAAIKDKVDNFAHQEKFDVIISKWELNYFNSNAEIVDITEQLANLFQPKIKVKDMLNELMKSEPIKDAYLIED